jgi:hypothetical protein
MLHGRFFTEAENLRRRPVVVLGEDLGRNWFQNTEPVGKSVEIDGQSFEVGGVMKRPAASRPGRPAVAMDEARAVLRMERRLP